MTQPNKQKKKIKPKKNQKKIGAQKQ